MVNSLEHNEPVAYQFHRRADWVPDWSLWEPCSKEQHEMYLRAPKLHDWVYETRALYAQPNTAVLKQALEALDDTRYVSKYSHIKDAIAALRAELGGMK